MLENDDSNLQTKLGGHITSNIFKIITGSHQPLTHPPTLKVYPTPGEGGMFDFFSAKMKVKDEF